MSSAAPMFRALIHIIFSTELYFGLFQSINTNKFHVLLPMLRYIHVRVLDFRAIVCVGQMTLTSA